jgi:hypothetical protein
MPTKPSCLWNLTSISGRPLSCDDVNRVLEHCSYDELTGENGNPHVARISVKKWARRLGGKAWFDVYKDHDGFKVAIRIP